MANPTMHLLSRTLTSGSLRQWNPWSKVTRVGLPSLQTSSSLNASKVVAFHSHRGSALACRHANEAVVTTDTADGDGPWLRELKKRGIYSEYRYGHYHQYKVDSLDISTDRKDLVIHWSDQHTSQFDAIWLRHQCHCTDCKHDSNAMVKIEWDSLPMDITILSAELEGDKMVVFEWGTPDGKVLHRGAVPTATLRCYCYSDKAIKDRREKRTIEYNKDETITEIESEEFFGSEEGVHKCLTAVSDHGICLVKNVPTNQEMFDKALGLIGPTQHTLYGEQWDVVATPNPINAAYSNADLRLHQDLPFYESAPGLQMLHCWNFPSHVLGGTSTFLDVHQHAHQFRQEQPELFRRLATLPATFSSIHYNRAPPVHFENQTTIFSLNHLGQLVSVNWNPNVQGPPELPKNDMVPFYEAYTAFLKMIAQSKCLYKLRYVEGDFIIFNNRRVLHGREAFSNGTRHLRGAYVQLSDFQSRIQALNNTYANGRLARRSGNRNWF